LVAKDPFEVVHCAPVEPSTHRHTLGRRPLKLGEVGAQPTSASASPASVVGRPLSVM
jgi:hypothetical protein